MNNELKPRIVVVGVGGGGSNAVDNMIKAELKGVDFVAANTDAQALSRSLASNKIQLGLATTRGLGAGARPEVGSAAAEESMEEITALLDGAHMVFVAAGMGGGTGTGSAPVIARAARERGILTVGVVTKPFQFEGTRRMSVAEGGLQEMRKNVDTLIVIPNQNIFRIANEKTTFTEAFTIADQVLYSGVRGITDLMTIPGIVNLDFADVRTIMAEMGAAMMGTGEASGEKRALHAAQAAISNPLLDDISMKGAKAVLINITGGDDVTLYEVDEATTEISSLVDPNANIIWGTALDPEMTGRIRVSVVATGIDIQNEAMRVNTSRGVPRVERPVEPQNASWLGQNRGIEAGRTEQAKPEPMRGEPGRPTMARSEMARPDISRPEITRPEIMRPEAPRMEAPRTDGMRVGGGAPQNGFGEDIYSQLVGKVDWDRVSPASEASQGLMNARAMEQTPEPHMPSHSNASGYQANQAERGPQRGMMRDYADMDDEASEVEPLREPTSVHKKISLFAWRSNPKETAVEAAPVSQTPPAAPAVSASPAHGVSEEDSDLVIPAFLRRAR
jgi:cell division protein FtsZ